HVVGQSLDDGLAETLRRVESGTDRGTAQRQLADAWQAGVQPLDADLDRLRVAAELLPQRDRRGVHQMGAARLDDILELALLLPQRLGQVVQRRDEVLHDRIRRRDVDGRREYVVRRQWIVDAVVGADLV